ncbi:MAG: hypothetical protein AB1489_25045 [Acidobacteriota bacterium]
MKKITILFLAAIITFASAVILTRLINNYLLSIKHKITADTDSKTDNKYTEHHFSVTDLLKNPEIYGNQQVTISAYYIGNYRRTILIDINDPSNGYTLTPFCETPEACTKFNETTKDATTNLIYNNKLIKVTVTGRFFLDGKFLITDTSQDHTN